MIWKIVLVTYIAHNVLCERDAISEQRVVIHHLKPESSSISVTEDKKQEYHEEYPTAYPSYEFSYKVNDPETQDIKGQHEKRHGDEVKGLYWLVEPNGHKRTVNYQANDFYGFNAQINYSDQENNKEISEKIESEVREENVNNEENNANNNENNEDKDSTKNQETENLNTEISEQGNQKNNEQVKNEDVINGETENEESDNQSEDEKGADSEIVIKTKEPYYSNVKSSDNFTVKNNKILQNNNQQNHSTLDKTFNEVNGQVINHQKNKKPRNHGNTKHNKNKRLNGRNNANVGNSETNRDDRRRGENNKDDQVKILKKQNNNNNKLNDVQDLYISNVNNEREPTVDNNKIRIINLDTIESNISNDEMKNAKTEHRIYIRHPKFPTTNSKNKKH